MVVYSIIAYVIIAGWYIFGSSFNQFVISIVGTCLSGFFAFWFKDISKVAMIIYFIMGVICIFFHWISLDINKKIPLSKRKNKTVTAVLALFFGICGVHKFYLKRSTSALFYVLFAWTLIPGVIGVIESICIFAMNQESFDKIYNGIESQTESTIEDSDKLSRENNYIDNECIVGNNPNERNGDTLNYCNISVCGYEANAIGKVEDFSITMKVNGNTYIFKAKNGDICSYRSSTMRETKYYEVT